LEEVQFVLNSLKENQLAYKAGAWRKYVIMTIGIVLGIILGIVIPSVATTLTHAQYSRKSLDNIMKELLGKYHVKDALSDEVLMVAYDYNSQEPRFFSKFFSEKDPAIYDITFGNATGASSAAPTYFDPK